MADDAKPDMAALFEAFGPALWYIGARVTENNEKHGGRKGRLGGRTATEDWAQSRCRHAVQSAMPPWFADAEDAKDHLAAEAFNALGQLTEMLKPEKENERMNNRFQGKPFVYLAMRLSEGGRSGVVGYLRNLGRMIAEAAALWALGYPVFIPGLDCLLFMVAGALDIPVGPADVYANSLAIQERCDVLYVPPDEPLTDGVAAEYDHALRLGQPIVRHRAGLEQVHRVDGKWVVVTEGKRE